MTKHHFTCRRQASNVATLAGGFSAAKFPAGLVDTNAEMFSDGESLKGTYNGQTFDFNDLPTIVKLYFSSMYHDIHEEEKQVLRDYFEYSDYTEELEQWIKCNFGGFDNYADFSIGTNPKKEYWNCGYRGKCPAEGIVCKPDCIINNNLHLREADVIKCLAAGMTDQEIADNLEIELNTARTHERNIREKLGFNHRGEIIRFAFKNNIIF